MSAALQEIAPKAGRPVAVESVARAWNEIAKRVLRPVADHARQLRHRLVDARSVAEGLGLAEGALRQARGLTIRCPWHIERTPSCSLTVGADGTLRAHCFGCGESGDVLHLIAAVRGLDIRRDFRRVLEEAAQLAGMTLDHPRPPRVTHSPAPVAPALPNRPPEADVATLWESCLPAFDDAGIHRALAQRAIDPAHVTDRDLARALPEGVALPPWAAWHRRSWYALGNRLVLPMYDDAGKLSTLHARRLGVGDAPKGLSPAGFSIGGTVFADPLGRLLLAGEDLPWWTTKTIIISEGGPDFLTLGVHYGDADEQAPAVLGVIAGSFTDALAARLPSGCKVIIRTHHDDAGDKYASEIVRRLEGRCLLFRAVTPDRGER